MSEQSRLNGEKDFIDIATVKLPDFTVKAKKTRKRSANRDSLIFSHFIEHRSEGMKLTCIRAWKNDRQMVYYDCLCAKRKPIQDLQKIYVHVERMHFKTAATNKLVQNSADRVPGTTTKTPVVVATPTSPHSPIESPGTPKP